MRWVRGSRLLAVAAVAVGCSAEASSSGEGSATCRVVEPSKTLPADLPESSGLAASRRNPGVLWTHNDSGDRAEVFAVDAAGRLMGTSEIPGARNKDWEDIAVGPCAGGDCLYIADTGDNDRKRDDVAIYRVPEPAPGARTGPAERLSVSYPGGSRDIEAMFVLPSGEIYLISKGRKDTQTLYRFRPDGRAERIVDLGSATEDQLKYITGASASPSGRWVAIREYKLLSIYRTADLVAGRVAPALEVDLTEVGEAQGEGVTLLDNGRVVLTSEGGFKGSPGTIAILQCEMPSE
ncbi:MAG: hypothetical protein KY464_07075 [Gemmatimonadetes bacterium]|nr:hypothetical protein [Gemmatimonadota bacterium]